MSKPKKSVEDKVQKQYPDFAIECSRLSVADLNTRLLNYAKHAEEIEDSKDADVKLEEAKAMASELGAPYRDAKKAVRLKMRYIMGMIKDMGGA